MHAKHATIIVNCTLYIVNYAARSEAVCASSIECKILKIIFYTLWRVKTMSVINAGKFNKKITIYQVIETKDSDGFPIKEETIVLEPYAKIKTTRGYTLITNNSDFEKAYTNFTIRYPITQITRDMLINFNNKTYTIEYLNNVNEENTLLEIQAKEVTP